LTFLDQNNRRIGGALCMRHVTPKPGRPDALLHEIDVRSNDLGIVRTIEAGNVVALNGMLDVVQ